MTNTDLAAPAAMPDVLAAVASELSVAMGQCARLDGALGRLLDAAPAERRGAVLGELHTVDLLSQQIAALAGFVERLALSAPGGLTVDVAPALDTITLGEVADRLRRGVGQECGPAAVLCDDLDLF